MLIEAFGTDVRAVAASLPPRGRTLAATLFWTSGLMATIHGLKDAKTGFQMFAVTDDGPIAAKIATDRNPYLASTRRFCEMFKTGVEPMDHRRILAPVAVLEALDEAIARGGTVRVGRF
jgi:hypothetical protein